MKRAFTRSLGRPGSSSRTLTWVFLTYSRMVFCLRMKILLLRRMLLRRSRTLRRSKTLKSKEMMPVIP